MRRPLVAGNWKMNGSRESVVILLQGLKQGCERVEVAELAVFPPAIFLAECESELLRTQIACGAQNMSSMSSGAYTGELSADMLLDYHCSYVILGHSERRQYYGETSQLVAEKCRQALASGLKPIVCLGETEQEREQGETLAVVGAQLACVLDFLHDCETLSNLVIAYEPVWAIGTGKVATPQEAQEVHAAIRAMLSAKSSSLAEGVRILYGGSVKATNAAELFAMQDIDGALVGGASLDADQFLEIGMVCNN